MPASELVTHSMHQHPGLLTLPVTLQTVLGHQKAKRQSLLWRHKHVILNLRATREGGDLGVGTHTNVMALTSFARAGYVVSLNRSLTSDILTHLETQMSFTWHKTETNTFFFLICVYMSKFNPNV